MLDRSDSAMPAAAARNQPPLVCVDSDGCVFDTMEVKQKRCFHPLIVSFWNLGAIERAALEACEFVTLYSRWRGLNRFANLVRGFDVLRTHPGARGAAVPDLPSLRRFVNSGVALGHPELSRAAAEGRDAELERVLEWSVAVNERVGRLAADVPPVRGAPEALEELAAAGADVVVVSQTPSEALAREWRRAGLDRRVRAVFGQEHGSKAQQVRAAAGGGGAQRTMLLLGDAEGDLRTAQATGARFFPIRPGAEEDCWADFRARVAPAFLGGVYSAADEQSLAEDFLSLLPEVPPWRSERGSSSRNK
jgi:phosphoglycolate phosphatase-like HAD superfamily hydrolase